MTNLITTSESNATRISVASRATTVQSSTGWPLAACVTWLTVAAIETVIGVSAGWPAQFMGKGDPNKVASEWINRGTAISPPLFLFVAVVLGGVLAFGGRRRAWRMMGGGLLSVVGLIGVVATIGELLAAATPDVPRGAQWSALIGTALSLALLAAGVSVGRARERARIEEDRWES